MNVNDKLRRTLNQAAIESGKILKKNFGGDYKVSSKVVVSNLVTEIDHRSEEKIISIIRKNFPEHSILTEESGELKKDSNYQWIIDPIDGTVNYAHGIPITCVSIALEKNGEVIMGVVHNPMGGEYFFAEKGKGAFLNKKKIEVSANSDIEKSLLVTGFPYNSSTFKPNPADLFKKFLMKNVPIRRLGSAALDLCWTACGRFDAFWEYNLNAWDVAAGALILKEAGGKLSNFAGKEYSIYMKEILATNSRIHGNMLKIINNKL